MDKYYYFASQLPLLEFGGKTYVTAEYFLAEAEKWLSAGDLLRLRLAGINDFEIKDDDSRPGREYKEFECSLREEIFSFREKNKAARAYKPSGLFSPDVLSGNPLEVEKKLLFLRWNFLGEKEEGHYFDLSFFVFYFLKIQILGRMAEFDKKKGTSVFDELCSIEASKEDFEEVEQ